MVPSFSKESTTCSLQFNPKRGDRVGQHELESRRIDGHAALDEMRRWRLLETSLNGPDAAGCFSGSCIEVHGAGARKRVYALYTGRCEGNKATPRRFKRRKACSESQCLAWSDDPLLRVWTKQAAAGPCRRLQLTLNHVTGFPRSGRLEKGRDLLHDGRFGNSDWRRGLCSAVSLLRSPRTGSICTSLTTGAWKRRGYTSNPVKDGEMWECPDFFALDGGHVLIYSTDGQGLLAVRRPWTSRR